jgi:hypothetical protein
MAIPLLNKYGLLPEGIYDCTMEEAHRRFGQFQVTDRRPLLWGNFIAFMREAKASTLLETVLIDGSFVTGWAAPNDIDLILVLPLQHDLATDLPPFQYNVLDQNRVRKQFKFDIVVVKNGSDNLEWAIGFFQQVRQRPGLKKGILRIKV